MKKRMLLAAVGDYQGFAPTLVAPVEELERWEQLLSAPPYGFTSVRPPLKDRTATRENILAGLEQLLADAQPDDQLVFVFCGHGSNVAALGAGGSSAREQVLIGYPDGDKTLRNASIRYSDVLAILERYAPDERADITFVLDACFAHGFNQPGAIPLFVPIADVLGASSRKSVRAIASAAPASDVLAFADLAMISGGSPAVSNVRIASRAATAVQPDDIRATVAQVVVVAASRKDEAAYQIQKKSDQFRLLFSFRALARLRQSNDTFDDFIRNINPLRQGFPQHAEVYGSPQRRAETFPGQIGQIGGEGNFPIADLSLPTQSIHMRILGLGAFIDQQPNSQFNNRIILPYDSYGVGIQHHFSFVEVAEDDIDTAPGSMTGTLQPTSHYRAGVNYLRWTLSEHLVWLHNGDTLSSFTRSDSFTTHVPDMTRVCPELTVPRAAAFDLYPDPTLFSAFFDLDGGRADIGQLEAVPTYFTRETGDVPTNWGPEKTPRSVMVDLYFTGPLAKLLMSDIGGFSTAQIFIKPGATILAGNAREADITGSGAGETPRQHFIIFYSLADPVPLNPGLPTQDQAPVNACSVVRFP